MLNLSVGQSWVSNVTTSVSWFGTSGGGTINNAGTFEKQGSGTLSVAPAFNNTGTVAGTSTVVFNGTFTNSGLIAPGASPGVLNLNRSGGLAVNHLAIELEGPVVGSGYDQLNNTTGAANLAGGTLNVTLLNGYLPNVGTSFTILTGTSRSGTFGTLNLPVDNARWAVTYNATNVVLSVVSSLPVELIDFQAQMRDDYVRLDWATASEYEHRGFGVERSTDGLHFAEIAFVPSQGDSRERLDYHFNDLDWPTAAPNWYYRLRQEDHNGATTYGPVRRVSNRRLEGAAIWPNPVGATTQLQVFLPHETTLTVTLADAQGRLLRQVFVGEQPAGAQHIPLTHLNLPAGTYLLCVAHDQSVEWLRVLVP